MCKKKLLNPPENHYEFWRNMPMITLAKMYSEGVPYKDMAKTLGRTPGAVRTRVCILRICVRMSPCVEKISGVMTYRKKRK